MQTSISRRAVGPLAAVLATVLLAAGCGEVEVTSKEKDAKADKTPSASPSAEIGRASCRERVFAVV